MIESIPNSPKQEKLSDLEYRSLGEILSQRVEGFPFPGLDEKSYAKLKSESEEFPDLGVHIDVLMSHYRLGGGIKVFVAKNGNVFIMPRNIPFSKTHVEDCVEDYGLFPKHLNITPDMDIELKKLILARR